MSEINQGKVIQVMGAVVDVMFEDSNSRSFRN
jgi:F0F1-type ATP synthase beta subunit